VTASSELNGLTIRCGVSHGDFAPWNTRLSDGRLFVFDWESAEFQSPNQWDIFHFRAQVSSLLNSNRRRESWLDRPPGEKGLHLLYLLSSVVRGLDEKSDDNQVALFYRRRLLIEELSA
jgi:RIO-like serine/threonine protein kinase